MKKLLILGTRVNEGQRLIIFTIVAFLISLILRSKMSWEINFLFSWVGASAVYLFLAYGSILTRNGAETRRAFSRNDPNKILVVITLLIAILLSNLGIGILLNSLPEKEDHIKIILIILSIISVVFSWVMIHTSYALHYCRLYYHKQDDNGVDFPTGMRGGVDFPSTELPSLKDFCYLSFTIGLSYTVSDCNITNTDTRMNIIFHGIISFLLYSTIFSIFLNAVVRLWGQ